MRRQISETEYEVSDGLKRRNKVVFRIRQLQRKAEEQRCISEADYHELMDLQDEAKKNEWLYW